MKPDPVQWRRPRRRPPWWPEGEPWPPQGGPPWAGRWGRRYAVRRFGCMAGLAVAVLGLAGLAFFWSLATALGLGGAAGWTRWAALVVLAALALSLAAAARAASRLAVPVGELISAAQRVEHGDFSARIAERGPGYVRSVARAFNSMSARLEAEDRQRRRFLADAAHELRTPLALIRAQTEAISDGVYTADPAHLQPILTATESLERLVEELRTLALAESGALRLDCERVDLPELLAAVAAAHQVAAGDAGIDLRAESEPALVTGDPTRLGGVLDNVVTNALRHTPSGGRVQLRARTDGDSVAIEVADTGSGIPAELLPHVFERFSKGAGSAGSGLGLAIALEIVQAHGGELTVESEGGRGSTFLIRLPRTVG